ncbi:MAG: RluA family pseudouridine synthase, partial [Alphaproteobacteria bacterium]|nr:RluA family pseudouridine synthase [Alphaproteobacteria bacterium]
MERHIHEDDEDIRVDRWFKRHMPDVSHGLLQKSLRKGIVRLDGKKAEANTRLVSGQKLSIPDDWKDLAPKEAQGNSQNKVEISEQVINDLEQAILFEDNFVLVLNKPAGLAVQGGTGQKTSVDDIFRARAHKRNQEPP